MKTTMLIVEFLVGGILVSIALGFLFVSLFPGEAGTILDKATTVLCPDLSKDQLVGVFLLLSTIFVAIAYTVGVFSEPIARGIFEWILNRIKRRKMENLKEYFEKDQKNLKKSPIVKEIEEKIKEKHKQSYGDMRFYVLMRSPELYQDIASQMHRYRLMRLLFLSQSILIIAVIVQLIREFLSLPMCILASPIVIIVLIFLVAYEPFIQYFESVKRFYKKPVIHLFSLAPYILSLGIILTLGIIAYFLQQPFLHLIWLLTILAITAVLNIAAIHDRFERYCRSIERSYKVLVFDQYINTDSAKTAPQIYCEMKTKRKNTEKAHQQFQNPLVGIIVFLFRDEKKEIAVFEQPDRIWKLPEKYARGDEWLKETVYRALCGYVDCQHFIIESCTLLSGGNDHDLSHLHDQKVPYQFNYVAFVKMDNSKINLRKQAEWISRNDLEDNTQGKLKHINIYPLHEKLLKEYFQKGYLKDDIIVPADLSSRLKSDKTRLGKTREIHADNFPMPSITVDGILLKFSDQCKFQGVILERRSRTVDREPGKWAFPAGFVCAHERVSEALAREVREEVGITLKENHFLSVYKHGTGPYRDPRWFVWTQFLVVYTIEEPTVRGKNEIDEVGVFLPHEIPYDEMAFDHGDVLKEFMSSLPNYIKRVEEKENECTP